MVAPDRYRVIVDAAAGRDLTRADMIDVLITAGYSRSSAIGRMSSSHPLFHRVGPDLYRVISSPLPVTSHGHPGDNSVGDYSVGGSSGS